MLCSALYYFIAAHSLTRVPEVVEIVVAGVEEVAVEVVHGSNKIVRCLTGVIIAIGTVAIVMVGVWPQIWLHQPAEVSRRDKNRTSLSRLVRRLDEARDKSRQIPQNTGKKAL